MGFRRFNRQIEVFDISLMAVVTKAMGAFLVIMLLLMPYYQSSPAFEKSALELQQQIDELQSRLAEMEKNVGRFKDDPDELKRQLAALIAQMNDARSRIVALQRQLDQAWSQNRRLEAEVATLERQNADLNVQKQTLDRELAAWRDIDKHKTIRPRYSVLVHARTTADCLAQKGTARAIADESSSIDFQIIEEGDAFTDPAMKPGPMDSTTRSLFALRLNSQVSNRLIGRANLGYSQTMAGHSGKNPFPNELARAETFTLFTLSSARGFLAAQRRPAKPDEIDCPVEIRMMVFAGALSQWVRLPNLLHTDLPALPPDHDAAPGPTTTRPLRPGESFVGKMPVTPLLLAFIDTAVQQGSSRAPLRLPTQQDVGNFKTNGDRDVVIQRAGSN